MIVPKYPEVQRPPAATQVIAYRKEGVFDKQISFGGRVTARVFADGTAVASPVSWVWNESPPTEVLSQLDALCADVGFLGEAESIAVLEVHRDTDPGSCTHLLEHASFFDDRGGSVDVPQAGRLDALETQLCEANPTKAPRPSYDKHRLGSSGLPRSHTPTHEGLASRLLVPVGVVEAPVPWATAAVLSVQQGPVVGPDERVLVARYLHRALIASIGQDCPPVVTGHYTQGVVRPANRVALHYLPPGAPLAAGSRAEAHLVALIPRGTAGSDFAHILRGVTSIAVLRTSLGSFTLGSMELLDGDQFWVAQPDGTHREWKTDPVAIPERQGSAPTREELLALTASWALGNVMRGLDEQAGDRDPKRRLAWLRSRGGGVIETESYLTPRPARFVHRTNRAMPVMPYVARLDLGTLVPPRTVLAIGQSRHLGGGLLVPVDRRVAGKSDD